jgi:hypothetical protein
MKRPAQLAILVFGLLALLASPAAEADPPNLPSPANLPRAGVGSLSAAVPAPATPTVQSSPSPSPSSSNNVTSTSPVTGVKRAVAPASRLDLTPPDNVAGLGARAGDRAVTLKWSPPADPDFNHVVIRRTPQTGEPAETVVYKGPAQRFVDHRLTNGVAYRYVVVSYDQTGNRSDGMGIIAAPEALMLVHPSDGARLKAPPRLRWAWIPGATFYNVQLFRGSMRTKVMTAWPAANGLQLPSEWVYAGRNQRLVPGIYHWVVWPSLGRQMAKRYGPLLGVSTFSVVSEEKKP